MSSTNGQPPLTRRQVRDLERAREAGEAITGSISVVSGSPVPSNMPVTTPSPASPSSAGRATPAPRPGSHVAAPSDVSTAKPGSAPAADGHEPTRRELRAQREASSPVESTPVPLKTPQPGRERKLADALNHVADIENGTSSAPARRQPAAPARPASAPARETTPASPSSPPHADAPQPRSFRRAGDDGTIGSGATSFGSGDDSNDASPVRRRSGLPTGGTSTPVADSGAVPAPTSTPTVFPFALSGAPASGPTGANAVSSVAEASRLAGESSAPGAPAAASPAVEPPAVASASASPAVSPAASPSASPLAAPQPAAAKPVHQASQQQRQTPSVPASIPQPNGFVAPAGHWSTQADLDDDDTIESVGSHFGTLTGQQNALILNDDALPDITGALNATGEVIITGSIDLPRSLAATGSHNVQRIDGADIDRMLEEGDREAPDNDATPVRASRAVSANTSTRQVVLTAGRQKSNRLPIIATVCGVALVLVIVGLVVVGLSTGVLSR